ncbi:E3 ubiquitin-protein ligase RNF152 isoform X1 [Heterocephalus glaber]|uniref:E3 ubiquitin-protein ligase RNF152 isoform X1 n=1 Tax=Heterocephalus glaber TaxID=10181 RepID=A0AAX6PSK5_HETGA|nr:E3 ubiquitin-protein ligase RNF152 isoform X1 [Heterocephalus glaber]XP_021094867.1 E3 ubiquitin-protein ligase RNF152 isoform X1 [Heterocephalus glaber]
MATTLPPPSCLSSPPPAPPFTPGSGSGPAPQWWLKPTSRCTCRVGPWGQGRWGARGWEQLLIPGGGTDRQKCGPNGGRGWSRRRGAVPREPSPAFHPHPLRCLILGGDTKSSRAVPSAWRRCPTGDTEGRGQVGAQPGGPGRELGCKHRPAARDGRSRWPLACGERGAELGGRRDPQRCCRRPCSDRRARCGERLNKAQSQLCFLLRKCLSFPLDVIMQKG